MKKTVFFLLAILFTCSELFASLYDSETAYRRSQEYPTALQVMCGNFPRHSEAFHLWRVKERQEQISNHADSLSLYDDLAVSYFRLGQLDEAISTMQRKEMRNAGLYETYANLATFYFYKNDFASALSYLNKVIYMRPCDDKELYELYLTEYIARKYENKPDMMLPLQELNVKDSVPADNFYNYLKQRLYKGDKGEAPDLDNVNLNRAIVGVLNLMRFSRYNSPMLLEGLGDLLYAKNTGELAAAAYIRASQQMLRPEAVVYGYRHLGRTALFNPKSTPPISYERMALTISLRLNDGDVKAKKIEKSEKDWIAEGKNPQIQFRESFLSKPTRMLKRGHHPAELIFVVRNKVPDYLPVSPVKKSDVLDEYYKQTGVSEIPEKESDLVGDITGIRDKNKQSLLMIGFVIFMTVILVFVLFQKSKS